MLQFVLFPDTRPAMTFWALLGLLLKPFVKIYMTFSPLMVIPLKP